MGLATSGATAAIMVSRENIFPTSFSSMNLDINDLRSENLQWPIAPKLWMR
jgi:hypothetical protein